MNFTVKGIHVRGSDARKFEAPVSADSEDDAEETFLDSVSDPDAFTVSEVVPAWR